MDIRKGPEEGHILIRHLFSELYALFITVADNDAQ